MIHHKLTIFDALIQRGFGVFPKTTIGNLCKPFHYVIIIPFSTSPESIIFGQDEGKFQKFEYLKKQKSILGETKSIPHNFLRTFSSEI